MKKSSKYITLGCVVVLMAAGGVGGYKYNNHIKYEKAVKENVAEVKAEGKKYSSEKDDKKKLENLKVMQKELKAYKNGDENDERVVKEYNKNINALVTYFKDKNDKVLKENTYDSSKETNKDVLQGKVNNLNALLKTVEEQKNIVYSTEKVTEKENNKETSNNESTKVDNKNSTKNNTKSKDANKNIVKAKESKTTSRKNKDKTSDKKSKTNDKNKSNSKTTTEYDKYVEKVKEVINGYNKKVEEIKVEEQRKAEEARKAEERRQQEQKAREEGKVAFNEQGIYVGEGSPEAKYNAAGQTQEQIQSQSSYNAYSGTNSSSNAGNYSNGYNNSYSGSENNVASNENNKWKYKGRGATTHYGKNGEVVPDNYYDHYVDDKGVEKVVEQGSGYTIYGKTEINEQV